MLDDEIKEYNNDDVVQTTAAGNKNIDNVESIDFKNLTMKDVDEKQAGDVIVDVKRVTWDRFSAKQLRRICSHFGVRGYKDAKKSETIEIVKRCGLNKKAHKNALNR
jgi:hypothetical protein